MGGLSVLYRYVRKFNNTLYKAFRHIFVEMPNKLQCVHTDVNGYMER